LISHICAVIPVEEVTDVMGCIAKELERYLKPKEVNKMLMRLTDEAIREAKAEAKAEAWAKAWAKGEAKGLAKGLVKSILIALENRLGANVALKTIERKLLDLKDEEKLTGIMKRALNCQSLDDFNTDFY
jgi:flagellar biosynthesis/type III secretory pathway protein FliH